MNDLLLPSAFIGCALIFGVYFLIFQKKALDVEHSNCIKKNRNNFVIPVLVPYIHNYYYDAEKEIHYAYATIPGHKAHFSGLISLHSKIVVKKEAGYISMASSVYGRKILDYFEIQNIDRSLFQSQCSLRSNITIGNEVYNVVIDSESVGSTS